jgi:hypothetical protein
MPLKRTRAIILLLTSVAIVCADRRLHHIDGHCRKNKDKNECYADCWGPEDLGYNTQPSSVTYPKDPVGAPEVVFKVWDFINPLMTAGCIASTEITLKDPNTIHPDCFILTGVQEPLCNWATEPSISQASLPPWITYDNSTMEIIVDVTMDNTIDLTFLVKNGGGEMKEISSAFTITVGNPFCVTADVSGTNTVLAIPDYSNTLPATLQAAKETIKLAGTYSDDPLCTPVSFSIKNSDGTAYTGGLITIDLNTGLLEVDINSL